MDNNDHTVSGAVLRTLLAITSWLASLKLADLQSIIGIVTGLIVAGYSLTQWWVLWRDKVRRRRCTKE